MEDSILSIYAYSIFLVYYALTGDVYNIISFFAKAISSILEE